MPLELLEYIAAERDHIYEKLSKFHIFVCVCKLCETIYMTSLFLSHMFFKLMHIAIALGFVRKGNMLYDLGRQFTVGDSEISVLSKYLASRNYFLL